MPYKPSYLFFSLTGNRPHLTPFYDAANSFVGLGKRFHKKIVRSIPLVTGSCVADIGCGTGAFLHMAQQAYPSVRFVGFDPDPLALAIAKRRTANAGMEMRLEEAFAESLPLSSSSVDACFSTLALHHMPDDIKRRAIGEMHRILKKGGRIAIADLGANENRWMYALLFFEVREYIEGNFNGLLPRYLKEAGFKNIIIVDRHFPGIEIVTAEK